MLVEYSATNMQDIIGRGNVDQEWDASTKFKRYGADRTVPTGTTNAVWRGIHELWGNCVEYADGAYTDTTDTLYIFSKQMDGIYVKTSYKGGTGGTTEKGNISGVALSRSGYILSLSNLNEANYDFTDCFIPAEFVAKQEEGTFHSLSGIGPENMWTASELKVPDEYAQRPQTSLHVHGGFISKSTVGPFSIGVGYEVPYASSGFRLARRPI